MCLICETLASCAFHDLADLNDLSRLWMNPSGVPVKIFSDPVAIQLTLPCCSCQLRSPRESLRYTRTSSATEPSPPGSRT
jgi:hypothetical protein